MATVVFMKDDDLPGVEVEINLEVPDLRIVVARLLADLDLDKTRDAPAVALVQRYAAEIENANRQYAEVVALCQRADDEQQWFAFGNELKRLTKRADVTDTVTKLGPLLLKALSELGGTPLGRKLLDKTSGEKQGGRLSQLRNGLTGEEEA